MHRYVLRDASIDLQNRVRLRENISNRNVRSINDERDAIDGVDSEHELRRVELNREKLEVRASFTDRVHYMLTGFHSFSPSYNRLIDDRNNLMAENAQLVNAHKNNIQVGAAIEAKIEESRSLIDDYANPLYEPIDIFDPDA